MAELSDEQPGLWPAPRIWQRAEGVWTVPALMEVRDRDLPVEWAGLVEAGLSTIARESRRASRRNAVEPAISFSVAESLPECRDLPASVRDQAFCMEVTPHGVGVSALGRAGIAHAVAALRQLFRFHPRAVPCGRIVDWPDLSRRGYMLDISRCKVPTMAGLQALVDDLALLRYNNLQLYTEHTFAFSGHELVWADASPMTPQEVRDLDRYCRLRGIELIPNLNSFGHFERWLRHPEYRHLAICPDGFTDPWGNRRVHGSTLLPGPDALQLLEELYAEFLPCFSSRRFNIGCDETWDIGQGRSREMAERSGGSTTVYLDFLNQVHALASADQREVQFWADVILENPEHLDALPRPLTGMIWGYEADHPFAEQCARFAETGLPFEVVPGTSAWNTIGGRWQNARENLRRATREALASGAEGLLLTEWGDRGHHHASFVSDPARLAGAGLAWNARAADPVVVDDGTLATWLDRLIFRDPLGGTGAAILALGRTVDRFEHKPHNTSPLNRILFARDSGLSDAVKALTDEELRSALEHLAAVEAMLGDLHPGREDADLLLDEVMLAVNLLRHAAHRGLAHRQGNGGDDPRHRGVVRRLAHEFERLWLQRNRHGGLREASGYLRAAAGPD